MRIFIREHVPHVPANRRVNPLRHEQRAPEIAPLAAPIQMGTPQALTDVRELSWAEEYENNDQYEDQMSRLEQAFHFILAHSTEGSKRTL